MLTGYIGQTLQDPDFRLRGHLSEHNLEKDTPSALWLKELSERGVTPKMSIICEVDVVELGEGEYDVTELNRAETHWIAHHRAAGTRLLNVTKGGGANIKKPRLTKDGQMAAKFREYPIVAPHY